MHQISEEKDIQETERKSKSSGMYTALLKFNVIKYHLYRLYSQELLMHA